MALKGYELLMIKHLIPFLTAFILSVILTPLIIRFSHRYGFIAKPKEDRWHKKPTALLGGIGIFLSFLIPFILFIHLNQLTIGILICFTAIFSLGLFDDILEIRPCTKFIFQFIIAIAIIFFGIKIQIIPYPFIAIPLTIFWIVGITNAFNILDNMDGLSSGISFIASSCIFLYALKTNFPLVALFSSILSGASLGFLIFNFNPAKIFMGDCGSLFLGFNLSIITILGPWKEATNLLFTIIVPLSIMAIPIFDTTLVSFQRKLHGRSISQGGQDHSSHRLVFLGLSEKRAVSVLMELSLLYSLASILLSEVNVFVTLIILSILTIFLLFFGIFLGEIKVYAIDNKGIFQRKNFFITPVVFYKKQILQIIVDLILISTAYISAYLLRYEGILSEYNLRLIENSLPILVLTKFGIFSIFGLYRGEWRFIGINDMIQIIKSVSLSSLVMVGILLVLFRFEGYSRSVFIIDYILTLLMISGNRILIRMFKEYFFTIAEEKKEHILIIGAGRGGELLLHELKNNSKMNYKPLGFIDDDLKKKGKIFHGLKVLGTRDDIPMFVEKKEIKMVIISIMSADDKQLQGIYEICTNLNVECRRMKSII